MTAAAVFEDLSQASREGRFRAALTAYLQRAVLGCDEVGYLSCGSDAANVLFHFANARCVQHRCNLFTTNKPLKDWGAALHDYDLAEAIIDRVLERGRIVSLEGPSMRTRHLEGIDYERSPPAASKPASIEPAGPDHPLQPSAAVLTAALGTATASLQTQTCSRPHPLCSGSSRPAKISGIHQPQFSEPTDRQPLRE